MIATKRTISRSSVVALAVALFGCPKSAEDLTPPVPKEAPASMAASQPEKKTIGVEYVDSRCGGSAPCMCRGEVGVGLPELKKIGVDETVLAIGTPCLLGDFDGNGSTDGAFLGEGFGKKAAVPVVILLFDDGGVLSLSRLPRNVGSLGILRQDDGTEALVETEARLRFDYADGRFTSKSL